jgi:hypothetical protein
MQIKLEQRAVYSNTHPYLVASRFHSLMLVLALVQTFTDFECFLAMRCAIASGGWVGDRTKFRKRNSPNPSPSHVVNFNNKQHQFLVTGRVSFL